jgi:16S rRNA (adenine1518-N6/adenine1519-N6)-dimethyltransferase
MRGRLPPRRASAARAAPVRRESTGHVPRRRFGQHFLVDREVLARIVDAVAPRAGDHVLEIGPGTGALTAALIERAGSVQAIEIDRDLAAALRARFPARQLQLIEGDALAFDYGALPGDARVVGNLPYNISTPLLFKLCRHSARFRDLHFMLQKEVVARMAARPSTPEYGRLSVMLQHWFRVERLFDVPAGAFRPAPRVESSAVRLLPRSPLERGDVDEDALRRVVTAAFSHRRKTLGNALAGLLPVSILRELGIDPRLRPENLELFQFVALAKRLPIPKA